MTDKHKVTLEYQAKQSREIKRLKADHSRMLTALKRVRDANFSYMEGAGMPEFANYEANVYIAVRAIEAAEHIG